jgi:hypothetical protein
VVERTDPLEELHDGTLEGTIDLLRYALYWWDRYQERTARQSHPTPKSCRRNRAAEWFLPDHA